jgi:hypothetical protein
VRNLTGDIKGGHEDDADEDEYEEEDDGGVDYQVYNYEDHEEDFDGN